MLSFILSYFLLSVGSLGEAMNGVINENDMCEVIDGKLKHYFYFENASVLHTIMYCLNRCLIQN